MASDNIRYKDRLFTFLFGSEENKAWTLSLYNAINNTDYKDPSIIEITTIKEIMYMGMKMMYRFWSQQRCIFGSNNRLLTQIRRCG